jgi:hypothetical protein
MVHQKKTPPGGGDLVHGADAEAIVITKCRVGHSSETGFVLIQVPNIGIIAMPPALAKQVVKAINFTLAQIAAT